MAVPTPTLKFDERAPTGPTGRPPRDWWYRPCRMVLGAPSAHAAALGAALLGASVLTERADTSKVSVRVKIDVYVALFCLRGSYTQPQTLHTLDPLVLPLCSRRRDWASVSTRSAILSILKIAINFDEISELTSRRLVNSEDNPQF